MSVEHPQQCLRNFPAMQALKLLAQKFPSRSLRAKLAWRHFAKLRLIIKLTLCLPTFKKKKIGPCHLNIWIFSFLKKVASFPHGHSLLEQRSCCPLLAWHEFCLPHIPTSLPPFLYNRFDYCAVSNTVGDQLRSYVLKTSITWILSLVNFGETISLS